MNAPFTAPKPDTLFAPFNLNEAVLAHHEGGSTLEQAADDLGLSTEAVRKRAARMGITWGGGFALTGPYYAMSDAEIEARQRLADQAFVRAMARAFAEQNSARAA